MQRRVCSHTLVTASLLALGLSMFAAHPATAADNEVLFDGSSTEPWEFNEGAWSIDDEGALTCHLEEIKQKNGTVRKRGMGYIWTKKSYGDFELTLTYRLSEGANSGVFFRADPSDPVQAGFEIQLLDDQGFQPAKGKLDGRKRHGALYDSQAPRISPAKPVGQWNAFKLTCHGPEIRVEINGQVVNEVNIDDWNTAGANPDGTPNKFKTALKDLPRQGRIGFQNHGQVVWFKDVVVRPLGSVASPR